MTNVQENKKKFVENELEALLKAAYSYDRKIVRVYYVYDEERDCETVNVELEPLKDIALDKMVGRTIRIDVTGDSLSALTSDVVGSMNRHY